MKNLLLQDKIKTVDDLKVSLDECRRLGKKIVHCHGVFDLLHPGHIRHFKEAKRQGDILVVSITADQHVNKGPGRPVFNELIRSETLASLECVDFVAINNTPDAIDIIKALSPDIYVKGIEYKNHEADVTGKITAEVNAVESVGGKVHYTDDIVFSSSSLLNKYFSSFSEEQKKFLESFKSKYSLEKVLEMVDALANLRVLVVGDAIIDEYQYVEPLGQSGKGLHMVARNLDSEAFIGGSLIIASHLSSFVKEAALLTAVGKNCPFQSLIDEKLSSNTVKKFIEVRENTTLVKKRYILKDGNNLTKLFETYSSNENLLSAEEVDQVVDFIKKEASNYDLVLVCDFGNGFTNQRIIDALSEVETFLAVNTQINSGNRGYNVVTHYKRADFISLNEPEIRLSAHDRSSSLECVAEKIANKLDCNQLCITRGVKGVQCLDHKTHFFSVPPFTESVVDRVGAGDCFLALAALCSTQEYPLSFAAFIGSVAAAMGVQTVGNKEPINKVALYKFITRLMK